jgi:hypothetical protein
MASSTIELQRTINRSSQFVRLEPLVFAANTANDPAFSNADWVMQTILAPPFAWRWNRTVLGLPSEPAFTTTPGVTDYKISAPNFGWLERGACYDPTNGYFAFEMPVKLLQGQETLPNQPNRISAQYDDGEGNITFRLFPAPDSEYNVVLDYQNAASLFTEANQTWSPIPDYLSYVYNSGFDAKTYEYLADPRQGTALQIFYQQLAEASEGLNESQKNLWLEEKLNSVRQSMGVQSGKR